MILSKAQKRKQHKWARQRKKLTRGFRRPDVPRKFVDHPRWGDQPIISGEDHSEAEVRAAHWSYARVNHDQKILFPETAIRANPMKQRTGHGWRRLYVDIARPCRSCGRWFIFFALEQEYWYEDLGFFIDADCVHCQECRHEAHEELRARARYTDLLAKTDKTREEWEELSRLGDHLYETGHIKKAETLLKTRAPKRLRGVPRGGRRTK